MKNHNSENNDLSKQCSKCPILIKEVAVIKNLQLDVSSKLETLTNKVDKITLILLEKLSK
jgi:hypothetical protein